MNKQLLAGLGIGLLFYYLFVKAGKKPCNCHGETDTTIKEIEIPVGGGKQSPLPAEPSTCEEAVAIIMAELRKTSRMTEEAFALREKEELRKCKAFAATEQRR